MKILKIEILPSKKDRYPKRFIVYTRSSFLGNELQLLTFRDGIEKTRHITTAGNNNICLHFGTRSGKFDSSQIPKLLSNQNERGLKIVIFSVFQDWIPVYLLTRAQVFWIRNLSFSPTIEEKKLHFEFRNIDDAVESALPNRPGRFLPRSGDSEFQFVFGPHCLDSFEVARIEMNSSSTTQNLRGRVSSRGRISSHNTMANGDTTNRTTNSKLSKNDVNHLSTSNSNRVNAAAASENKSSGGRIRRRSAPPVTIEGTLILSDAYVTDVNYH